MTGPNGHAQDTAASTFVAPLAAPPIATPTQFSPEKVREVVAALEVPFDPSQIEWRVMNTTKNGQPMRGQVVPYADQRAYTDRLNAAKRFHSVPSMCPAFVYDQTGRAPKKREPADLP